MSEFCLVIFIDAYPFWALKGSRLTERLSFVRPVRPGFGYSINCQAELFTGKSPDELGYWCEYSFDPGNGVVRSRALSILDTLRPWRIPNRACHRFADKLLGKRTKDIPFAYLPYFSKSGKEAFSREFPFKSILKNSSVRVLSYLDFLSLPNPKDRDESIFDGGIHLLKQNGANGLVLALGNFDNAGHWNTPGTEPYWAARDAIEARTLEVLELAEAKYPDCTTIVISDHGMSPVERCIDLQIERHFGIPDRRRYVYFLEGTILRIWSADTKLRDEMECYLHEFTDVEVLSEEERNRLGIATPSFGDLIAVTNDGTMWVPSFWGSLPSKGMHGYHPRHERQHGIFLSNRAVDHYPSTLEARQVAEILSQAIPEPLTSC